MFKTFQESMEYDPFLSEPDLNTVPVEIHFLNGLCVCGVAVGDKHSMALSVFGEVWTWGGSSFGQLGHGSIMDEEVPHLLKEMSFLWISDL